MFTERLLRVLDLGSAQGVFAACTQAYCVAYTSYSGRCEDLFCQSEGQSGARSLFFHFLQEITVATPINSLTSDFAVAPQMTPDDMAAVAAAGFKSVIINRPDFEDGPNQPTAAAVSEAARAAGLRVAYQPVVSGQMTSDDVTHFSELLQTLPAPVLAYCRSGTRCTVLYRAATGNS